MNKKYTATLFAILAAALYAINIPLSKMLLHQVSPTMMAAFLYLGAGLGLFIYHCFTKTSEKSEPLTNLVQKVPFRLRRSKVSFQD